MKFVNVKCENCGADLTVDFSHGHAYCQYCGNKLYADYSDPVLIEKEKTEQKRIELSQEKEKTKQVKIEKGINDDDTPKTEIDLKIDYLRNWTFGLDVLIFFMVLIFIDIILFYFL